MKKMANPGRTVAFACFIVTVALASGQNGRLQSPDQEKKNDTLTEQALIVFADTLEKGELFEGDLKLSTEQIRQVYDIRSMPIVTGEPNSCTQSPSLEEQQAEGRNRRDDGGFKVWPEGIIYYSFDASVSASLAFDIRSAMDKWEEDTCLHFVSKDAAETSKTSANCVNFTAISGESCFSDSVGLKGGVQLISLGNSECHSHGEIMHLIGHAVGFWHEQSRPDRNKYIRIIPENIDEGRKQDFMKFQGSGEEYQSSGLLYDYGSIMHFSASEFSKCESSSMCPTLVVRNPEMYMQQGSPMVGQRDALSAGDLQRTTILYTTSEDWKCPPSTKKGRLVVNVLRAYNLSPSGSSPNVYVKITAEAINQTDGQVMNVVESTTASRSWIQPTWDELLDMGGHEFTPFFRIQIWNDDSGTDSHISVSEQIMIDKTYMENIHCADPGCHGYIQYTYNFTEDGNECLPEPCQNGGTCTDGISTYTCQCSPGWTGTTCNIRLACYSTPCENGGTCTEITDYTAGTSTYTCSCPPDWIGRDCHSRLACSNRPCRNGGTCTNTITNYDAGTSTYTCSCPPTWIGTNCQDRCPCKNSGTCAQPATVIDYRCLCPYGWIGTNCDIRRARLRFYVRYGIGLPDEDGWFNDSDPYVKIIAYDRDGNSVTRTSSVDGGDESPEWNQWLDFGVDTWAYFNIKVYDSDWNSDDSLSNWQYVAIYPGSSTYRTHYCHSGYIKYDYHFE